MNYRHAFHAGGFADCFKHALLVALLDHMARKPAPFCVLDTHAGAGRYDLDGEAARRTGEAEAGIRRLLRSQPPTLRRYLRLVQDLGAYPGSPLLVRALLRPDDRLVCCELHPDDARALRAELARDRRVAVHRRSGWEALGSLLPPKQPRGFVFIDPPFEDPGEFATLAGGLARGHRRFARGVFAAWYPIKQLAAVRAFIASVGASGIRDVVAIELTLREPTDPGRLNGCGLLVVNPPFRFEDDASRISEALLLGLDAHEAGAGVRVVRVADE